MVLTHALNPVVMLHIKLEHIGWRAIANPHVLEEI